MGAIVVTDLETDATSLDYVRAFHVSPAAVNVLEHGRPRLSNPGGPDAQNEIAGIINRHRISAGDRNRDAIGAGPWRDDEVVLQFLVGRVVHEIDAGIYRGVLHGTVTRNIGAPPVGTAD